MAQCQGKVKNTLKATTMSTFLHILKVNSCQSRCTRSLKERPSWKANEWKIWFFFWIPLLKDYVSEEVIKHLGRLTFAVNTLLRSRITKEEIEYTAGLLKQFCVENEDVFGTENATFNVHLLLHACDCVLNWGPLW